MESNWDDPRLQNLLRKNLLWRFLEKFGFQFLSFLVAIMYQPRCPSVYLWSSSTYFQKVSAIYPQILFLFCNFLFPPSKDKHLTCSCPMSLLSLIISLIIVYSLFHIWKLEVQNVKLNLLLKNCFENNPNWWDIIDLNTSLTFQDVDESLNIADHTHHIMLPLSNLCCVCLDDICLECSNKAFIDRWDLYGIKPENTNSEEHK